MRWLLPKYTGAFQFDITFREKDAILDIRLEEPSMWMFMTRASGVP